MRSHGGMISGPLAATTVLFKKLLAASAVLALAQSTALATPLTSSTPKQGDPTAAPTTCISQSATIEQKLSCIEGLTFKEKTDSSLPSGVRYFEIQFVQPVDHSNPKLSTFSQRLVLLHRTETAPMVLQTSGYSIYAARTTRLAAKFGANQIQVEHRYFSDSRPTGPLDWSKLDIEQSAKDFHAIVQAFKAIYPARWVNTGASKGGMTSIYHRYFYPDDVDGTVADVAPLSFSTSDTRYIDFLDNVGGENYKSCRDDYKNIQRQVLQARDQILSNIKGEYAHLGGSTVAFEHLITESSFYFWQYGNPDSPLNGCAALPNLKTPQEMFAFIEGQIAPLTDYSDSKIAEFLPYYYQAATQLGSPGPQRAHLSDLLRFDFIIDQYTPKSVSYSYSNTPMHAVENWVRTQADKIIFVYGEWDPWTAGAFPVSETGHDVYKFIVPKGNHGAKFVLLPEPERARAVAIISDWLQTASTPDTAEPDFSEPDRATPYISQPDRANEHGEFLNTEKMNPQQRGAGNNGVEYLDDLEFRINRANKM